MRNNYSRGFLSSFLEFKSKYDDLKEEKEKKRIDRQSKLDGMEKYAEIEAQKAELRRLCNRREMYDDEGRIIPQIPAFESSRAYQEIAKEGGVSWICDKCMATNFGIQNVCAECGDVKDEKDERLYNK